jgi:hypothetical protein
LFLGWEFRPLFIDNRYPKDDHPGMGGYQHYGNACDADYDNNGIVELEDFNDLRTWFGKLVPPAPAYIDCNDDGVTFEFQHKSPDSFKLIPQLGSKEIPS